MWVSVEWEGGRGGIGVQVSKGREKGCVKGGRIKCGGRGGGREM